MSPAIRNDRDPGPHRCLVAFDICGCTGWVSVLGYGHDADAYREAAKEIKAGFRVTEMDVDEWKARGSWHCADHPDGPPWWKGRGKAKRPTEWPQPVQVGIGL